MHIWIKDDVFDVIYSPQNGSLKEEEESAIALSRINALQAFEYGETTSDGQLEEAALKEKANTLYKLKDFDAAVEYYTLALSKMNPPIHHIVSNTQLHASVLSFSVGQSVLVCKNNKLDYVEAIVTDVKEGKTPSQIFVDVMWSDDINSVEKETGEEDEEEMDVSIDRVVPLPNEKKNKQDDNTTKESIGNTRENAFNLIRSIFLNLARCELKRNRKGWAIKFSSIAVSISKYVLSKSQGNMSAGNVATIEKFLADALYFRINALLLANRPKFANTVIQ